MLARLRQRLGQLTTWTREQVTLSPDLKHLDDGATRWHFGDDPQGGVDFGDTP